MPIRPHVVATTGGQGGHPHELVPHGLDVRISSHHPRGPMRRHCRPATEDRAAGGRHPRPCYASLLGNLPDTLARMWSPRICPSILVRERLGRRSRARSPTSSAARPRDGRTTVSATTRQKLPTTTTAKSSSSPFARSSYRSSDLWSVARPLVRPIAEIGQLRSHRASVSRNGIIATTSAPVRTASTHATTSPTIVRLAILYKGAATAQGCPGPHSGSPAR